MNPHKAKEILNNEVSEFNEKIWDDIDKASKNDKYLVIQNPKNKHIFHVMRSDVEQTNNPKLSDLESICHHYKIARSSLFTLIDEYDECSEIKTRTEIKNDDFICKKCSKQI